MAKPSKIPEWAINDVVNPTSGQNNVVEPSGAIKNLGWDFKEKPPRQYFNWLQRYNYLWCKWVDDNCDQGTKTTDSPTFSNVFLTNNVQAGANIFTTAGNVTANVGRVNGAVIGADQVDWSSNPGFNVSGITVSSKALLYRVIGKLVYVTYYISGTNTAATVNFDLPFNLSTFGIGVLGGHRHILDFTSLGGAVQATGYLSITVNQNNVVAWRAAAVPWPGSGSIIIAGSLIYNTD